MKIRERLKNIRQEKAWYRRKLLVDDQLPGTKFDLEIGAALQALATLRGGSKKRSPSYIMQNGQIDVVRMAEDTLRAFGEDFAAAIKNGNAKLFRDWADAVEQWHEHKPVEHDKRRQALVRFCVPPTETYSVRDIVRHYKEIGLVEKDLKSDEIGEVERQIRRDAKLLRIKISGATGRPKGGHESQKGRR